MIQDPFTDDPTIRALCDTLSPDEHTCTCGHGIQDHAVEWVGDDDGPDGYEEVETVTGCYVCLCEAYGVA